MSNHNDILAPNLKIPPLVSTEWLADKLASASIDDFRILQAVYPDHCYSELLIPNSSLFNASKCQNRRVESAIPNMLPTPDQFSKYISQSLGIGPETHVIVYDASGQSQAGLEAGPRLWYTFRIFGHEKVSVLNGGLAKWCKENRPLTKSHFESKHPQVYEVNSFRSDLVVDFNRIQEITRLQSHNVVDARSESRFQGKGQEPLGGKSGGIPGSLNLPFTQLVNPETLEFLDRKSLEKLFLAVGVDHSKGSFIIYMTVLVKSDDLLEANDLESGG